jgi:hypothetical protein
VQFGQMHHEIMRSMQRIITASPCGANDRARVIFAGRPERPV